MAECKHLVDQRACLDCTPRPSVSARELVPDLFGPWFTAAYDGHCAGCRDQFRSGDTIRADGQGGWLAPCCGGDSEPDPLPPGPAHTDLLLERMAAGQLDTGKGSG